LQEGIYIATPDDCLIDANPALARMLGYDSKEELLSRTFADLLPDEEQRRALREQVDKSNHGTRTRKLPLRARMAGRSCA